MNPIIPIWLIYFAGVCEGLKTFFMTSGVLFIILMIVGGISSLAYNDEWTKFAEKCLKLSSIGVIAIFISMFIPTQKTVYTIIIGSQITPQNIELVGGTVKSTVDYMFDKTENLIKTVKGTK